jgi:signal peptidase II
LVNRINPRVRSAIGVVLLLLLDQATKVFIRDRFSADDLVPVIRGIFNIVHAENAGAAFSMLADASPMIRQLVLLGLPAFVLTVIALLLWSSPDSPRSIAWGMNSALMRPGLTLIFAGALGNLIDRVFRGTVTDFIQVFIGTYEFPSFNVADTAINIGAGLLIVDLLRNRKAA